jgi:hypothetical protein
MPLEWEIFFENTGLVVSRSLPANIIDQLVVQCLAGPELRPGLAAFASRKRDGVIR